jgi:hypothetical protein
LKYKLLTEDSTQRCAFEVWNKAKAALGPCGAPGAVMAGKKTLCLECAHAAASSCDEYELPEDGPVSAARFWRAAESGARVSKKGRMR